MTYHVSLNKVFAAAVLAIVFSTFSAILVQARDDRPGIGNAYKCFCKCAAEGVRKTYYRGRTISLASCNRGNFLKACKVGIRRGAYTQCYIEGGKIYGAFTLRVMLQYMPAQTAADLKDQLAFEPE